jgi:hypothetical protein
MTADLDLLRADHVGGLPRPAWLAEHIQQVVGEAWP